MESSPSEVRPRSILGITPLIILLATLTADQVTKLLVVLNMHPGQSIPASGFFRLTYVTNSGSAFGLFPNQTLFLVLASFVGIGVLLIFYRTNTTNSIILRLSIGLQMGGAIGNLVDRVRLGYVVDFIDLGAWPVFNLADSAIMVGLAGLFLTLTSTRDSNTSKLETDGENMLLPATSEDEEGLGIDLETTSVVDNSISGKKE
jgi:signal peptidase II